MLKQLNQFRLVIYHKPAVVHGFELLVGAVVMGQPQSALICTLSKPVVHSQS